jgi:hypothetical protein
MQILAMICQTLVALGLLNVWLARFNQKTAYRGGNATNMKEEFAAYGLPLWSVFVVGVLKVGSALALLVGLFYPSIVIYPTIVIVALMLAAIAFHLKIGDPAKKALPALFVLVLCLVILASRIAL